MRSAFLPVFFGALTVWNSAGLTAADPVPPEGEPVQISVKLESLAASTGALEKSKQASLRELLHKGALAGEPAASARAALAAQVASGSVVVLDSLTLTTLDGVPARLQVGAPGKPPVETAFILPRLAGGQIVAEVRLTRDGRELRRTLSLPSGSLALFRFPHKGADAKAGRKAHEARERFILLRLETVQP